MSERFSGLLRCCSVHAKGYTSNLDCTRPEVLTREKSKVDSTYCTTLILKKKICITNLASWKEKGFNWNFIRCKPTRADYTFLVKKHSILIICYPNILMHEGLTTPLACFLVAHLSFFFFFQTVFLKMPVSMVIRSCTLYLEKIK